MSLLNPARRVGALALAATLAVGMSGCGLVQQGNAEKPLTGIAACALGKTWNLDMTDLAAQLQQELSLRGVATTVTVTGTETLAWDLDSSVILDADYTVTGVQNPAEASVLTVKDVHSGTSTGVAYINAEVAIPRNWDATGLTVTSTADLDGAPVDPIPYAFFKTDIDDLVGLELTCDAGTMTITPRGSDLVLKWTS